MNKRSNVAHKKCYENQTAEKSCALCTYYTRHNNTKWPVIYDQKDNRSHKFWKPHEKRTKIMSCLFSIPKPTANNENLIFNIFITRSAQRDQQKVIHFLCIAYICASIVVAPRYDNKCQLYIQLNSF